MPATEDPKPKKKQRDPLRVLELFHKNLDAIYKFYNREKVAGQVLGYNSMLEIVFGHASTAMEYALQDKEWKPL